MCITDYIKGADFMFEVIPERLPFENSFSNLVRGFQDMNMAKLFPLQVA